jgi:hypothetical protein
LRIIGFNHLVRSADASFDLRAMKHAVVPRPLMEIHRERSKLGKVFAKKGKRDMLPPPLTPPR